VAALLNIPRMGRNKLFAFLRERKILDSRNIPYREYQERGYFKVVESFYEDSNGQRHIAETTYVYQKGLDYIGKLAKEPNGKELCGLTR
jgi:phage antirepressor YoqD-like protein